MSDIAYKFVSLGLIVLLVSLYMRQSDDQERLSTILNGLLRAEEKGEKLHPEQSNIAVGFGGCLDIFEDGLTFLETAKIEPPEKPVHYYSLNSEDELAETFAYFFQHGAAGERYVSSKQMFKKVRDISLTLDKHRFALGGNAPVMANRMAIEGGNILLGAFLSANTQKMLHPSIQLVGNTLDEDDLHIILEYAKDAKWGKYQANRANRFIIHSDNSNPTISSLESFADVIDDFSPQLLVVGGLQMMDSFPFHEGVMSNRLTKLQTFLSERARSLPIHFELASFADENLMSELITTVVRYSDSLGMNEQELPNLHSVLSSGNITLISDPYPRVAVTLDQMRAVWKLLRQTEETDGRRKITRIHVHTLAYQAIMVQKNSNWKNTMSAAAKASLTAYRHVCGSNEVDTEKARLIMDDSFSTSKSSNHARKMVIDDRPVTCWDEDEVEVCIAPVLVCTNVVQTGGGGDNVSSAGLVLQI